MSKIFYHGGVTEDFSIKDIDIYQDSKKPDNKYGLFKGFYMFDINNRDEAFQLAENANSEAEEMKYGVAKISVEDDINLYILPPYAIKKVTTEQINLLQLNGYDLMVGRVLDQMEYVLLNTKKITKVEFESMDKRYSDEIEIVKEDDLKR